MPSEPVKPRAGSSRKPELVEASFTLPGTWVIPLYLEPLTNANKIDRSAFGRAGKHRRATAKALAPTLRYLAEFVGKPVQCRITRLGRTMDDDNLSASAKYVRDTIALFLGCDDGPRGPVVWSYSQELGPVGVRVELKVLQ